MSRSSSNKTKETGTVSESAPAADVLVGLHAVIVSVQSDAPQVYIADAARHSLSLEEGGGDALPFGPFEPGRHRTLELGLRDWVRAQTPIKIGYVEQLYTFGDAGRYHRETRDGPRVIAVGYLALTNETKPGSAQGHWQNWYDYFPWEDWREGMPDVIRTTIEPELKSWASQAHRYDECENRLVRAELCFGFGETEWDEEKVLERYELLYEAGLVAEAKRDARARSADLPDLGIAMQYDHRRILATAMGRLRGKVKYRPVIFELMPATFTLFQLRRAVEALSGTRLHKQNFRRLVEQTGLVEETGKVETQTGGRPAGLFRFRREVLRERPAPGVKLTRKSGS